MLCVGDLARFKKSSNYNETGEHVGIIIDIGKPCSDGEITYWVLCDDSVVRIFFDFEAAESLSTL
tara:strand:+ start:2796 stop:2990 length:195 start_codon:yes stop_codon:yes gene_type:complete